MSAPDQSFDREFLFVTGKGGVGKTTVCAALAVRLASQGKRVLVAMCNAKERLSQKLGSDLIGPDVMAVAPNVWAVNIDPEQALTEYGMLALRSKALVKLLFENAFVRSFFRGVPGMQEWTMLGKAWWHTTEELDDGSRRFDVVILDAPATGHGLDMLRVPKVIVDVVPTGPLRRDAEAAWRFFQDPTRTSVVLVTLPEEMPTTESIELSSALRDELGLPLARIVVNAVLPPLFDAAERDALVKAKVNPADNAASAAVAAAQRRAERERVQAESLARLAKALDLPTTHLPLVFEDAATPEATAEFAKRFV